MERNNNTTDKIVRGKKWDCFFAFYRNYGFYKLWLLMFLLSTFVLVSLEAPTLLVSLGSIIVSTIVSLILFGAIIMFSDIPNESTGINGIYSIGKARKRYGDFPSAQTMRMLKRNIRRRWL